MDPQVEFNVCTNPEDMKRAIDKAPKLTKGDWVLALQHALDMMRKSQTRIEERDWHKLNKQLWQRWTTIPINQRMTKKTATTQQEPKRSLMR